MKKFAAIITALFLCMSLLASCGSSGPPLTKKLGFQLEDVSSLTVVVGDGTYIDETDADFFSFLDTYKQDKSYSEEDIESLFIHEGPRMVNVNLKNDQKIVLVITEDGTIAARKESEEKYKVYKSDDPITAAEINKLIEKDKKQGGATLPTSTAGAGASTSSTTVSASKAK